MDTADKTATAAQLRRVLKDLVAEFESLYPRCGVGQPPVPEHDFSALFALDAQAVLLAAELGLPPPARRLDQESLPRHYYGWTQIPHHFSNHGRRLLDEAGWRDAVRRLETLAEVHLTAVVLGDPREQTIAGSIRWHGANWEVRYGQESGSYPIKGFTALANLAKVLSCPQKPVDLKDLVDASTRALLDVPESRDDVLDDRAGDELHCRADELQREIDNEVDPEKIQMKAEQRLEILAELKKRRGLGNRKRPLGSATAEQVWDTTIKGIRRLWKGNRRGEGPRLVRMPELAAHLEKHIRFDCPIVVYEPPADTARWDIEERYRL